jgi:hypothetical protein
MLGSFIGQGHERPGEVVRNKLDLVGVIDIRWDKGATVTVGGGLYLFMERETKISFRSRIFLYTTE